MMWERKRFMQVSSYSMTQIQVKRLHKSFLFNFHGFPGNAFQKLAVLLIIFRFLRRFPAFPSDIPTGRLQDRIFPCSALHFS
jgi:hypothetical protein